MKKVGYQCFGLFFLAWHIFCEWLCTTFSPKTAFYRIHVYDSIVHRLKPNFSAFVEWKGWGIDYGDISIPLGIERFRERWLYFISSIYTVRFSTLGREVAHPNLIIENQFITS